MRHVVILVVLIAIALFVGLHPISPARTHDAYEHKAKDTAETVLSAVQTARLGARVGSDGDAFGPYVSVLLSESETAVVEGAGVVRQRAAARRPLRPHRAPTSGVCSTRDRRRRLACASRRGAASSIASRAEPRHSGRSPASSPLHREPTDVKKILGVTLGILTAIGGFVDIGDIVANSATGARFGMSLAWAVVARRRRHHRVRRDGGPRRRVTQRATFDLVRERLGARAGLVNLGASFFITLLTLIAEVAGVALVVPARDRRELPAVDPAGRASRCGS